jgi:Rab-GTPase-TBC domain
VELVRHIHRPMDTIPRRNRTVPSFSASSTMTRTKRCHDAPPPPLDTTTNQLVTPSIITTTMATTTTTTDTVPASVPQPSTSTTTTTSTTSSSQHALDGSKLHSVTTQFRRRSRSVSIPKARRPATVVVLVVATTSNSSSSSSTRWMGGDDDPPEPDDIPTMTTTMTTDVVVEETVVTEPHSEKSTTTMTAAVAAVEPATMTTNTNSTTTNHNCSTGTGTGIISFASIHRSSSSSGSSSSSSLKHWSRRQQKQKNRTTTTTTAADSSSCDTTTTKSQVTEPSVRLPHVDPIQAVVENPKSDVLVAIHTIATKTNKTDVIPIVPVLPESIQLLVDQPSTVVAASSSTTPFRPMVIDVADILANKRAWLLSRTTNHTATTTTTSSNNSSNSNSSTNANVLPPCTRRVSSLSRNKSSATTPNLPNNVAEHISTDLTILPESSEPSFNSTVSVSTTTTTSATTKVLNPIKAEMDLKAGKRALLALQIKKSSFPKPPPHHPTATTTTTTNTPSGSTATIPTSSSVPAPNIQPPPHAMVVPSVRSSSVPSQRPPPLVIERIPRSTTPTISSTLGTKPHHAPDMRTSEDKKNKDRRIRTLSTTKAAKITPSQTSSGTQPHSAPAMQQVDKKINNDQRNVMVVPSVRSTSVPSQRPPPLVIERTARSMIPKKTISSSLGTKPHHPSDVRTSEDKNTDQQKRTVSTTNATKIASSLMSSGTQPHSPSEMPTSDEDDEQRNVAGTAAAAAAAAIPTADRNLISLSWSLADKRSKAKQILSSRRSWGGGSINTAASVGSMRASMGSSISSTGSSGGGGGDGTTDGEPSISISDSKTTIPRITTNALSSDTITSTNTSLLKHSQLSVSDSTTRSRMRSRAFSADSTPLEHCVAPTPASHPDRAPVDTSTTTLSTTTIEVVPSSLSSSSDTIVSEPPPFTNCPSIQTVQDTIQQDLIKCAIPLSTKEDTTGGGVLPSSSTNTNHDEENACSSSLPDSNDITTVLYDDSGEVVYMGPKHGMTPLFLEDKTSAWRSNSPTTMGNNEDINDHIDIDNESTMDDIVNDILEKKRPKPDKTEATRSTSPLVDSIQNLLPPTLEPPVTVVLAASLDFRSVHEDSTDQNVSAVVEPSWDASTVLFNEYTEIVTDVDDKEKIIDDPFLTSSWGATMAAETESTSLDMAAAVATTTTTADVLLHENMDTSVLDPLGWPVQSCGLLANVIVADDPFGEEEAVVAELDDDDDGEDLLQSHVSRSMENDGDNTDLFVAESLSKEERIQVYESIGADDESSVENEEALDPEESIEEMNEELAYVSHMEEDESENEPTLLVKTTNSILTNFAVTNYTNFATFEPLAAETGSIEGESPETQMMTEPVAIPRFQPPPPPPPGSKKTKKKSRRNSDSHNKTIPLLAPPPEEKLKKWENGKARQIEYLQMKRSESNDLVSCSVSSYEVELNPTLHETPTYCSVELEAVNDTVRSVDSVLVSMQDSDMGDRQEIMIVDKEGGDEGCSHETEPVAMADEPPDTAAEHSEILEIRNDSMNIEVCSFEVTCKDHEPETVDVITNAGSSIENETHGLPSNESTYIEATRTEAEFIEEMVDVACDGQKGDIEASLSAESIGHHELSLDSMIGYNNLNKENDANNTVCITTASDIEVSLSVEREEHVVVPSHSELSRSTHSSEHDADKVGSVASKSPLTLPSMSKLQLSVQDEEFDLNLANDPDTLRSLFASPNNARETEQSPISDTNILPPPLSWSEVHNMGSSKEEALDSALALLLTDHDTVSDNSFLEDLNQLATEVDDISNYLKLKASNVVESEHDEKDAPTTRRMIFPSHGQSSFDAAIETDPTILSFVLDFLGDPVAVCRTKMLSKSCFQYVDQHEHMLIRDAVRLGGMNMNVRPSFWLWVVLCKGHISAAPSILATDDSVKDSLHSREFSDLESEGREGKWHHVIGRDVSRAFGTLPPHKTGARLRTDSIVRALVTWGRSRILNRGVKGIRDEPALPRCDETTISDDASLSPTDTVSDWGGVTPVGSFSGSFASSNSDPGAHGAEGGSKPSKSCSKKKKRASAEEELALGANMLTEDMKAALRRKLSFILHALAAAHPEVGYCQGMDYLVAHLLRMLQDTIRWKAAHGNLPSSIQSAPVIYGKMSNEQELSDAYAKIDQSLAVEETCFRVMDSFFTSYSLQHFYWPELRCLKTCCRVFEKIIQIKLPVLADHFEHHELNVGLFALGWFQTLFLYLPSMPSATVCHMWDIWLVERSFKIFFRVGTAILFLSQPILLNHELEGMMGYLNTFPDATLLCPDILIACSLQIKITNRMLMELEQEVKDSPLTC